MTAVGGATIQQQGLDRGGEGLHHSRRQLAKLSLHLSGGGLLLRLRRRGGGARGASRRHLQSPFERIAPWVLWIQSASLQKLLSRAG